MEKSIFQHIDAFLDHMRTQTGGGVPLPGAK
jgi:hypothetical protein